MKNNYIISVLVCFFILGAEGAKTQDDFDRLVVQAGKGDAESQATLGVLYDNGVRVVEDDSEAARWYRLAAEQGHSEAQYGLGVLYAKGDGVLKNDKEALRWFRLSAEQGCANAQYTLGVFCAEGIGTPQNNNEAIHWLQRASKNGIDEAKSALTRLDGQNTEIPAENNMIAIWLGLVVGIPVALLGISFYLGRAVKHNGTSFVWWYLTGIRGLVFTLLYIGYIFFADNAPDRLLFNAHNSGGMFEKLPDEIKSMYEARKKARIGANPNKLDALFWAFVNYLPQHALATVVPFIGEQQVYGAWQLAITEVSTDAETNYDLLPDDYKKSIGSIALPRSVDYDFCLTSMIPVLCLITIPSIFILRRQRWAWLLYTALSLNLILWIVNSRYYFRRKGALEKKQIVGSG